MTIVALTGLFLKRHKKNIIPILVIYNFNLNDFTVLLLQNDKKLRMINTIHQGALCVYEV